MNSKTLLAQFDKIRTDNQAAQLVKEVFEIASCFSPDNIFCPLCNVQGHDDECWFARAEKWLKDNNLEIPELDI